MPALRPLCFQREVVLSCVSGGNKFPDFVAVTVLPPSPERAVAPKPAPPVKRAVKAPAPATRAPVETMDVKPPRAHSVDAPRGVTQRVAMALAVGASPVDRVDSRNAAMVRWCSLVCFE